VAPSCARAEYASPAVPSGESGEGTEGPYPGGPYPGCWITNAVGCPYMMGCAACTGATTPGARGDCFVGE